MQRTATALTLALLAATTSTPAKHQPTIIATRARDARPGVAVPEPVAPPRIILAPKYTRSVPQVLPHFVQTGIVRWNAIRRYALRRYVLQPAWMNWFSPCPPGYRYAGYVIASPSYGYLLYAPHCTYAAG